MSRGSLRRATFLLIFSILTPACIVLPMVLNATSLAEVLLANLLSAAVAYTSLKHLSACCIDKQIFDYYTLVFHSFSRPGRNLVGLLMVLHGVFMVASYMSLFNFFVPNIYKPLNLDLDPKQEKTYTLILANMFITLPLSIFRDFENMIFTKLSNAIGVGYIVLISVYDVAYSFNDMKWRMYPAGLPLAPSFACIFSVYTAYLVLPTFENFLFEPNEKRVNKMLFRTLAPLSVVYLFLSFSPFNYMNSPDKYWASISEEMMILINLIIVIPTSIMNLRSTVLDILDCEPATMRCFGLSFVITVVACCIAIFFDRVIILFSLCGFINVLLMVWVPSKCYLVLINDSSSNLARWAVRAYGLSVLVIVSYGLYSSLRQ